MIKNLTVNMPLAVPTQKRPPGKYASHPYPLLLTDSTNIKSIIRGDGLLLPDYIDSLSMSPSMIGVGALRETVQKHESKQEGVTLSILMTGIGKLKGNTDFVEMKKDELKLSAKIIGAGILKSNVIKHTAAKENIRLSTKLVGAGVLS